MMNSNKTAESAKFLKYLVARRPRKLIRIPVDHLPGLGVTKDDQYKVEIEKTSLESNVFGQRRQ